MSTEKNNISLSIYLSIWKNLIKENIHKFWRILSPFLQLCIYCLSFSYYVVTALVSLESPGRGVYTTSTQKYFKINDE